MATIILTVSIFILAAAGLGLGLLFRRCPLKGSCGGASACLCQRKNQ